MYRKVRFDSLKITKLMETKQFAVKQKWNTSMQQVIKKLSFIGLGQMGRPLAEKLLAAGYPVTGYDKCKKVEKLFSGQTGNTLRDALKDSDLVITMLPSGKEVEEVLLKNNNFLKNVIRWIQKYSRGLKSST